jgi:small neutral amino acid transporter SnatA (MarC family)
MRSWNVAAFVGTLFVIVNLCGQLVPCVMILSRKKTDIACGILVFIIAFQVSSIVFSRTRKNETADTSILNTILLMLPYVIRQLF